MMSSMATSTKRFTLIKIIFPRKFARLIGLVIDIKDNPRLFSAPAVGTLITVKPYDFLSELFPIRASIWIHNRYSFSTTRKSILASTLSMGWVRQ